MVKVIKTYPIRSATRNKHHLVQEWEDGRFSCSCEYYSFVSCNNALKDCRHIKKVIREKITKAKTPIKNYENNKI